MENNTNNINDYIRNNIIDLSSQYGLDYFCELAVENLNNENYVGHPFAYASLNVIFLDAYKSLKARLLNGTISIQEFELFELLKDARTFKEIKNFYLLLRNNLDVSLSYTVEFNQSSELGKKVLVKELNEEDNKYLLNISQMHNNDLLDYGKKIDKEWLVSFYDKYVDKLNNNLLMVDSDLVNNLISSSLISISKNNRKEIYNLVSDLSSDVFNTINSITDDDFLEASRVAELNNIYKYDKKSYINTCLNNERIFRYLIDLYFNMKSNNLLVKKLKKD